MIQSPPSSWVVIPLQLPEHSPYSVSLNWRVLIFCIFGADISPFRDSSVIPTAVPQGTGSKDCFVSLLSLQVSRRLPFRPLSKLGTPLLLHVKLKLLPLWVFRLFPGRKMGSHSSPGRSIFDCELFIKFLSCQFLRKCHFILGRRKLSRLSIVEAVRNYNWFLINKVWTIHPPWYVKEAHTTIINSPRALLL